jgi:cellulose synthase/poly-beta-1,6-N-acetylglucosamine synthase-like glycosyltransferase
MGFADQYLSKQKGFSPAISDLPSQRLRFAVVVPAYCEPHVTNTLESLWNCQRPNDHIEVIIVVNSAENAEPEIIYSNKSTITIISQWIIGHHDPTMLFSVIEKLNMPVGEAGVGLARKTGMDEALYDSIL